MSSKVYSATLVGLETFLVEIEVEISEGKMGIHIVGLASATIQESRKRIASALRSIDFFLPQRYITLNLAPADLKKSGTGLDLPMAIALLHITNAVTLSPRFLKETLFIGELGLDGSLKSVSGIFSIILDAKKLGKKRVVIPSTSGIQSAVEGIEILCAESLQELMMHFKKERELKPLKVTTATPNTHFDINFDEIKGQYQAKRAMQIAAAGSHHVIFMGPPGSGKTMLANRLITIMDPPNTNEMLEITRIHSATNGGTSGNELIKQRPFRAPHHTISYVGLVGGGSQIQPGEITLSHNGVLFLDEVTEFTKKTLESLRQPLESKTITIARASATLSFPADFLLVAAFNPCPCGYAGDNTKRCGCSRLVIDSYLKKLSGPFLDRIDLQLTLQAVSYTETQDEKSQQKSSKLMHDEIKNALSIQKKRNAKNGDLSPKQIIQYCVLTPDAQKIIEIAFEKLNLSMRGYHKILKVSRTIADIEGKEYIEASHIKEALSYRQIDQKIAAMLLA